MKLFGNKITKMKKLPKPMIIVVGCLVNLFSSLNVYAALIAEFDPGASPYNAAVGVSGSDFRRGQTFIATSTAQVSTVSVLLNRYVEATVGDSVTLFIRNGESFLDPIISQRTVSGMSVPAGSSSDGSGSTFIAFDFSTDGIFMESGNVYSLWLERTGALEYGWWGINSTGGNAYSNGMALTYRPSISTELSLSNFDLGFSVTAVPELSSSGLLIIGGIIITMRRFRRPAEQDVTPNA